MNYRADIDGLRALAVLAVIINHLPINYFPSGFLGVDVFFVISGFVVTASLVGKKMPDFSSFYSTFLARRIKRLWPALTVCVIATSLTVIAVDPFPHASIHTGIASLFGFANISLFSSQLDYFAQSSKFNAFTHTWSLGVEEQFYVVFPIIFWVFFRGSKHKFRHLAYALASITLISVLLFIFYYFYNQPAAYFLMPMRMWELGAGSLAFLISAHTKKSHLGRIFSVGSPYVLIALLSCFLVPLEYAVLTTILSVAFTSLLLLNQTQTVSARALSSTPIVYVGKVSYSLYLYHWPVIVLAPLVLPEGLRNPGLYFVIIFSAAMLSYHMVESPLRRRNWGRSDLRVLGTGVTTSCVTGMAIYFALMNVELNRSDQYSTAFPPPWMPIPHSGLPYNPTCVIDGRKKLLTPQTFNLCTTAPLLGSEMPTIWLQGDSHAGHLQGLLYELNETLGLGVHLIETPGRPFPASRPMEKFGPRQKIHQEILNNAKPGDIVAVARLYFDRTETPNAKDELKFWIEQVSNLAERLKKRDLKLVIIGPGPIFEFEDIRECDLNTADSCSISRSNMVTQVNSIIDKLTLLTREHKNMFVFDTFSKLCPAEIDRCQSHKQGTFMYRDKDHLNAYGAKLLARPFAEWLRTSGILKHAE